MLQPVAWKIQFQNDAVVDETVNGRRCRHGVLEDTLPFGKGQITGNHQAPSFIAFSQEDKEDLHLLSVLFNVTDVVDN